MRIDTRNLKEEGLEVRADLGADWARDAVNDALGTPASRLELDVLISLKHEVVMVEGRLTAATPDVCGRCGAVVEVVVELALTLRYVPEGTHLGPEEGVLAVDESDMDLGWYSGAELDLAAVLTEAVAVALPPVLRCGERTGDEGLVEVVRSPDAVGDCVPPSSDVDKDVSPPGTHRPFAGLVLPEA